MRFPNMLKKFLIGLARQLFKYLLAFFPVFSFAVIPEKVLICGVCKNVEASVHNTIQSATQLGKQFIDYRVIIYENNSTDKTKELFQEWAKKDPHVIFLSENLNKKRLASELKMKRINRTEAIARARNKVVDVAMQKKYDDFKYVVWADLDFQQPWDIDSILDTIIRPEQPWDAVLANGAYDLFAYRDAEFPIGFELIGDKYWQNLDKMRARFSLDPNGPWKKVYSAFGGLGIYKRSAIKGCRYSGVVTKDLEKAVSRWLNEGQGKLFWEEYRQLLAEAPILEITQSRMANRKSLPSEIGIRMKNGMGMGSVVWFSCTPKKTLPWTCEHVTFHASMIAQGHDKIFVNPRLISNHP